MKQAIIIGASSGIGRALAHVLAREGYTLGLLARRLELLEELRAELPTPVVIRQIDVAESAAAIATLTALLREMGPVDLIIISAGVGTINRALAWEPERDTIAVNVTGFAALAGVALRHLVAQGAGQLVGFSSIAALRGNAAAPAYNASKAFSSNYLDGLRHQVTKLGLPITVLDVRPGFVDTALAQGEGLFWVAPPAKAAEPIYQHIRRRSSRAYITRRWRLVAWVLRWLPDALYYKL